MKSGNGRALSHRTAGKEEQVMDVFYFCSGQDETCSKEDCHKTGGHCCHATDRAFARETEGTRLFEELGSGDLFEIDPDGEA